MPPIEKRFPTQRVRKRKGRGRTYLYLVMLLAIIVTGVLVYVYELSPSGTTGDFSVNLPTGPTGITGITIRTNQATTAPITITAANGFRGTVKLTVTAPPNVTATVSPANITGAGTAILTMTATYPGNYTVTVTGTSGSLVHSVTPVVATPLYATLAVNTGSANGTIEVELYRAQTPFTVSNFANLAEAGFYTNLVWHRIATSPNIIQTGDPYTKNGGGNRTCAPTTTCCCIWGTGGSSQTVPLEVDRGLLNTVGTLGMARGTDRNSGSSQFYINVVDNPGIDPTSAPPGYTVFGKVIGGGMTLVQAIANHPVSGEVPLDPLPFLTSVTISATP